MGGSGSGNWWRRASGYTVEDCLTLDINTLAREGLMVPAGCRGSIDWSNKSTGEKFASVCFELTVKNNESPNLRLGYTVGSGENKKPVQEAIYLQTTKPHLGGVRWWFTCPNCGRRAVKLYIPPGAKLFQCRLCYRLTYQSQRECPMYRAISQAHKIRTRLGGSPSLIDLFPFKPKGMHWRTYEKLRVDAIRYQNVWLKLVSDKFGF